MLIKRTNLDVKDTACLDVVCILQHPTSRPTTKSSQVTTVNAPSKNLSPILASKYGNEMKQSTTRHHHTNEGRIGLMAQMVRALGVLDNLQSEMKLLPQQRVDIHIVSNEDEEEWIVDYVDTETTVARKRVQAAETAIMKEHEDISNAKKVGLTTRKPKKTFDEMLNAIGDRLSNLACSDDEEDSEDKTDLKKIQSWASRATMTNLAGGWAEAPNWYTNACRVFGRRRRGLRNWNNPNAGTRPTTSVREWYVLRDGRIDGTGSCPLPTSHDCSHTITTIIWRADADSWYHPRTMANAARDCLPRN